MISRHIDPATRTLYTTIVGKIAALEVTAYMESLVADALYSAQMRGLVDLRQATMPEAEEIRRIGEAIGLRPEFLRGARRALLVSGDAAYGLMRTLQVLAEGSAEYRVFRDEAAARGWLEGDVTG